MAKILLNDFIDIGTGGPITAVFYQIAKDEEFTKIIDEELVNTGNLREWTTPLPKLPEDGEGYYSDLKDLYGRIKIHSGSYVSPYYNCEVVNQVDYPVEITDGDTVTLTDTDKLGWKDNS